MIVTIIRHGQAGNAVTDASRQLTQKGIEDIGVGSRQLSALCKSKALAAPDRILHSAWHRTTQTAHILAAELAVPIAAFDALLPDSGIADVDRGLTALTTPSAGINHCLLVGHQPLVSQLIDHYLGQPGTAPALPPGGMVCIDLEVVAAGCGNLLFWAMPPQYTGSV